MIGDVAATPLSLPTSTMIAALILLFSLGLLTQFFFCYTRLVVLSSRKLALSQHVLEIAGIESHAIPGEQFRYLLQLADLCPLAGKQENSIRAVKIYFRALGILAPVAKFFAPPLGSWLEGERQGCSYFAALLLDRRLTMNRELMAQQTLSSF